MPVKITGARKLDKSMKAAPHRFEQGRIDASHKVGQILVNATRKGILAKDKAGRVYTHPVAGTYQASAPGQYSANVTGDLLRSIGYKVQGPNQLAHGIGVEYAKYLEDGTSKMEARPNLQNAYRDSEGTVRKIFGYVPFKNFNK